MFDIGGPELLMVAIVAILVVGPKDLPKLLRTVGHWVRRARSLAREFQSGLEDIGADEEIRNLSKEIGNVGQGFKKDMEKLADVNRNATTSSPPTQIEDKTKSDEPTEPKPVEATVTPEPSKTETVAPETSAKAVAE